jgi:hypothetical protein
MATILVMGARGPGHEQSGRFIDYQGGELPC